MLELKNVSKRYDYKKVLHHIDITFPDTGLIGIVGDSGCGKTTLLNIVGGIDSCISGDLLYNGKSMKNKLNIYRRKYVSFIFQNNNLISWLTPSDNISIAKYFKSLFKGYTYDHEVEYECEKVSSLSHGQRGFLSYLRAFFYDKDIIVADEPTGTMDSDSATKLMNHFKELSKDRLILLVSHDFSLVEEYCDEIYFIKDGYIDNHRIIREKVHLNRRKEKSQKPILPLVKLSLMSLLAHKKRTMQMILGMGVSMISILCVLTLSFNLKNSVYDYIYSLIPSSSISVLSHSDIDASLIEDMTDIDEVKRFHVFLDECELLGISFDKSRYQYSSSLFIHDDSSPYEDIMLEYGKYPEKNQDIVISLSTARHLLGDGDLEALINKKIYAWYKINDSVVNIEYKIVGISALNTQNDVLYQKQNAYVSLLKDQGITLKTTYGLIYLDDKADEEDMLKELSYQYKDMEFKISGKSTIEKADDIFTKIETVLFVFVSLIMLSSFVLISEVTFLNVLAKKKDFAIMKCFGASTIDLIKVIILESIWIVSVIGVFIVSFYYLFMSVLNVVLKDVLLIQNVMIKGQVHHVIIVLICGVLFMLLSQFVSMIQIIKLNTPEALKD